MSLLPLDHAQESGFIQLRMNTPEIQWIIVTPNLNRFYALQFQFS